MLINDKYKHLSEWLEQLPGQFEQLGEVIYDKRNQLRVIEVPDGTLVNAKRYCVPRQPNRLVYSLGIRPPKGRRAFLYPTRLIERGISTPEPIAYIEQRNRLGLLGESYFVSVQSPLRHTLYEFGDAKEGTYEEMARELGQFTAMIFVFQITAPLGTTIGSLSLPTRVTPSENVTFLSAITQLSSTPSSTEQALIRMLFFILAPALMATPGKMILFSTQPFIQQLSAIRLFLQSAPSP